VCFSDDGRQYALSYGALVVTHEVEVGVHVFIGASVAVI